MLSSRGKGAAGTLGATTTLGAATGVEVITGAGGGMVGAAVVSVTELALVIMACNSERRALKIVTTPPTIVILTAETEMRKGTYYDPYLTRDGLNHPW